MKKKDAGKVRKLVLSRETLHNLETTVVLKGVVGGLIADVREGDSCRYCPTESGSDC